MLSGNLCILVIAEQAGHYNYENNTLLQFFKVLTVKWFRLLRRVMWDDNFTHQKRKKKTGRGKNSKISFAAAWDISFGHLCHDGRCRIDGTHSPYRCRPLAYELGLKICQKECSFKLNLFVTQRTFKSRFLFFCLLCSIVLMAV